MKGEMILFSCMGHDLDLPGSMWCTVGTQLTASNLEEAAMKRGPAEVGEVVFYI